ncbi:ionotropic receptor 25a-like [Amphibalanus amphitrite]|uniref:ionotropic receptor 25a-like n=1 Tax=Amphibalanus amphitrite TaxID=1232801 RepID=UPI001C925820|nr:ionotropic receptor 25a-like [Amphibalanus amphitrite]XP_043206929.1 ionotropic receptor 25a-like [Amphibalanus amphitrite]
MTYWLPLVAGLTLILSSVHSSTVNLLFVNEKDNDVAVNAVDAAIKYIGDQNMGIEVNKAMVENTEEPDLATDMCSTVKTGIDAGQPPHLVIDTTLSGTSSEIAKSVSKVLAIPTVSGSSGDPGDIRVWRDLSMEEQKYLIQVLPPMDSAIQVIRKIVMDQNITSAGIIFDDSFVMDYKYKSLLQNVPCRHIISHLPSGNTSAALAQTSRFKQADLVNFFVLGDRDTVKMVLEAGNKHKLYGRKYAWFVISKGTEPVSCACTNATVIHIAPDPSDATQQKIEALKTNQGLTATPRIDAAFYFDLTVKAVKAISNMMDDGQFPADYSVLTCEAYQAGQRTNRTGLDLMSAMKALSGMDTYGGLALSSNGLSHMEFTMRLYRTQILSSRVNSRDPVGLYQVGSPVGEFTELDQEAFNRFKAVTVYRIVTLEQPPFIIKKMDENGNIVFDGYCIELLHDIQKILNFEYDIYEVKDGTYGVMNEDNEWNGMIRELVDKKADIALSALSVMAERENVVDFTIPYYDLVGITILMKKPKVVPALFKFLTVLETDVWGCILGAYFVTSILLSLFDRFSPYSYQNNREKYQEDDEKREFSIKESLWFCMTSLTPQGGGEAPKNMSGRLVAATWWLFGFIIIASYTANLAAFLTVSRLDSPIESLEGLAKQYKVQYAPMNGTSTMNYFKRMAYIEQKFYEIWKDMSLNDSMTEVERAKLAVWDYPVSDRYTKMWGAMQEAGLPTSFDEAVERVLASPSSSEGFAYLGDATDIGYQVMTSCDLQMVGDEFSRKPYAIAVQRGSHLKEIFNEAILKLLNQRKLEVLKEKWWNQNPARKYCEREDDQSEGISIQNIGGVFIVIFVGIALACITLLGEYWYYKYWKPSRTTSPTQNPKILAVRPDPAVSKTNFNTEYKSRTGDEPYELNASGNPW